MPAAPRARPELSRERILDAAQAIIDRRGDAALTFRALGAELEADPTAAYRHFTDKDDLLLALADRLLGEAMDTVPPGLGWRDTLAAQAVAVHRSLVRHPRLAVLVSVRTTQGKHEARSIELALATLVQAGFAIDDAVQIWRGLADTILAWAGFSAAYLSLPEEVRSRDAAWTTSYRKLPGDRYPQIAAARPYLDDDFDAFPLAVDLLLDGISARVPTTPKEKS